MNLSTATIRLFACVALFLLGCSKSGKKSISGKWDHARNLPVILSKVTDQGDQTIDSTVTDEDGRFELQFEKGSSDYYVLRTGDDAMVYLILSPEDKDIKLEGDAQDLMATYRVQGSAESELVCLLHQRDRRLSDSLNHAFAETNFENPQVRDSAGQVLEKFYNRSMRETALSIIRTHPDRIASLSASKFLDQTEDLADLQQLATSLSAKFPDNVYVSDFTDMVKGLAALPPGSPAPDITLSDLEGKTVSLNDFKGKVLLIDFWASWCGPCRRANPTLVNLYEKFRGKNFDILGVSLDQDSTAWKTAVERDGLSWTQVSELKQWKSRCVEDYRISAIPFSVLIDAEGNIVAKAGSAEDLEPKIRELLRKTS